MTLEDILQMPAGKEVNALVAEKVMGWLADYDSYHHWTELGSSLPYGVLFMRLDRGHREQVTIDYVPNYSTDAGAAWEMEERIKDMDSEIVGRYILAMKGVCGYHGKYSEMWNIIHATPLERCKAALIAMHLLYDDIHTHFYSY